MRKYITYIVICVRQVFEKLFKTLKFTKNNIVNRRVFLRLYKGIDVTSQVEAHHKYLQNYQADPLEKMCLGLAYLSHHPQLYY